MNPELLMSFDEVFMLTYLFDGQYQKAYLDYFGLPYEKGLNVLYGASETGKSFALEAINYMLGAKERRDIPERVGYNKILLGIEIIPSRKKFTLIRSTDGGQFLVFEMCIRDR